MRLRVHTVPCDVKKIVAHHFIVDMAQTNSQPDWKTSCEQRKEIQYNSIPEAWRLKSFPIQTNVLDIPAQCGILTPRELTITEITDVSVILAKLRGAEWSSVEVTTAFYKRAIIAHQLVSMSTI